MNPLKQTIIDNILLAEGGYVNDPSDSGGETNYGITEEVARANGYRGEMDCMPRRVAERIYSTKYWDAVRGDELAKLSEMVVEEVVDTSVNMGPVRAGIFLQRALNVLNRKQKLYDDVIVDGHIGGITTRALRDYLAHRGAETLTKALNCLQGAYYIELAERREKDERHVYGWLKNRVAL